MEDLFQSFGSMEPGNPFERSRDVGVPVGLKNVGNTCYVNSLLQSYFALPAIRNIVLQYRPPQTVAPEAEPAIKFLQALQRYVVLRNVFPCMRYGH